MYRGDHNLLSYPIPATSYASYSSVLLHFTACNLFFFHSPPCLQLQEPSQDSEQIGSISIGRPLGNSTYGYAIGMSSPSIFHLKFSTR